MGCRDREPVAGQFTLYQVITRIEQLYQAAVPYVSTWLSTPAPPLPQFQSGLVLNKPAGEFFYTARTRLGFSTVMIWICSSLIPRSRSRGRNSVAI